MDTISSFLTVFMGLALRLGLPVALTVLVIILLRRLDVHWQQESLRKTPAPSGNIHCWELQKCSEEKRATCSAISHPGIPCWQLFRSQEGFLREECIGCQVFRKAPAPAIH
jgi:hypothetical protein